MTQQKRSQRAKPGPKTNGQPKTKTHVSIDAHIYLIAKNTGNISHFLNEAAKAFITSKHFRKFLKDWEEDSRVKSYQDQKPLLPQDNSSPQHQ